MTEALSLATTHAADQRPPILTSELPPFHQIDPPAALVTEETVEDDDGEIACICAYNSDDGSTVQCDKCMRWQHISCYYPPPKKVPDDDQKHYCVNCVPQPDLDPRKANERQRRALEQHNGVNGVKRPAAKATRKKVKDSPSLTAQTNGWSDRHPHIYSHDRKSASPRDQPPPAKKTKTSHRSTNSISNSAGRRRAGTTNAPPTRSPSKSPEINTSAFIPQYSDEFLSLFQSEPPQVDTTSNLMDNISIAHELAEWLTDAEAVSKATNGLAPSEVFKRWDRPMEEIPGRPEVDLQMVEDPSFESEGHTPRWARLIIEDQVATGTFIGELHGRVGHRQDYIQEPESRWNILFHPEPFVFFHPTLPICIDARQEGSKFRHVRRSCQPNVELQTIITESTEYHFCFMATRDIMAGEEVTVAWQVPQFIRERINSSLKASANFQPKVREYISTWVSNVLANCGPCACNNQATCLMAHYDRRGQSPPALATKPLKRRKKMPPLDTGGASRSRSTSEVRKVEQDDEAPESRSASGSHDSASRDITPSHQYSGITSAKGMTELSERERKKLMREEEMFRRQEEATGRQKKVKRNSSGSALNTPSATSSRPPPLPTNGSSRYVDAGTSNGRPSLTPRGSGVKRKAGVSKTVRDKPAVARSQPATYVDASVQCDIEPLEPARKMPMRPRRRYISVTQRLLQQCVANNLKQREEQHQEASTVTAPDKMDLDTADRGATIEQVEPEVAGKNAESEVAVASETPPPAAKVDHVDTVMADVDSAAIKSESPVLSTKQKTPMSPPTSSPENFTSHPVTEVAAPSPQEPITSASPTPPASSATVNATRPAMHLDMPPPPSSNSLSAAATAPANVDQGAASANQATPNHLNFVHSPGAVTPGPASAALPLFSPSVSAAVMSPSPVRKKMSLSDYTKRSKAARGSGGEAGSLLATTPTLATPTTAFEKAGEEGDLEMVKGEGTEMLQLISERSASTVLDSVAPVAPMMGTVSTTEAALEGAPTVDDAAALDPAAAIAQTDAASKGVLEVIPPAAEAVQTKEQEDSAAEAPTTGT